ncbi:MAG: PepSY domain-containing protein, partial [Minwuiales bacterium]|nr:PepSY domain-containing protein [Minwuiales bacterium]
HGYYKPRPYHKRYHGHHRGHYKKKPVLPRRIIVRKLHYRDYDVRKIRYRDGYYRAHAYDRRGRPVKLLINPHNGRILKRRYRD